MTTDEVDARRLERRDHLVARSEAHLARGLARDVRDQAEAAFDHHSDLTADRLDRRDPAAEGIAGARAERGGLRDDDLVWADERERRVLAPPGAARRPPRPRPP